MTSPDTSKQVQYGIASARPVFLLIADAALAEGLTLDLRHQGLRARTFVNAEVLINAARSEAPLAIVVDSSLADSELHTIRADDSHSPALLFLGSGDNFKQRLRAVRAGGRGYYPYPVNRSALLHQLDMLGTTAASRTGRILIVDNKNQALTEVRQALTEAGFHTIHLDDPQRTLPTLQQESCQLLLLNDELDGMPGTELLQIVRQSLRFQALPAILLTRANKRGLDAATMAAGVDAVLGLPIAGADLAGIVQTQLERARQVLAAYRYCIRRDPDDGLFNRGYFLDALRQAVAEAATGHGRAALLWLETETGATAQVADVLLRQLPPLALAARMSKDSIATLLPALDADEFVALLEKLNQQLAQLPGLRYRLGTTLLAGRHRNTVAALEAARQAAAQPDDDSAAPLVVPTSAVAWAAEVGDALRENRFRLVYQPIASLSGQPTSYYEVFVRMITQDGGDISPQEFLAAAAVGDLAERLDRWVLARAVHVLESQDALRDKPSLFVKLFPDSISAGPALIRWLADAMRLARLEPSRLALQITQQCALSRPTETQAFIAAARELGCRIVLEHFSASGEAGQQLLQSLKPDFVRLAPQLTQDIGSNRDHQKLAEMIAGQCRAIGAKPIAALVQDALNLSVLWRCGIEYIQGYFMQEPVDVFSGEEKLSDA
jgi:EAL domain-containing protein (putative c-di-GMP-specific phosphodiesterase class I)/DNA-binding response OmpR family regulator